jgi:hypothetical protein
MTNDNSTANLWRPLRFADFAFPKYVEPPTLGFLSGEYFSLRARRRIQKERDRIAEDWNSAVDAVNLEISKILVARPEPPATIWGSDELRQRVALVVTSTVQKELEWPNCRFIPEDECSVVFWDEASGGDSLETTLEIECVLDVNSAGEQELIPIFASKLEDMVDMYVEKVRSEPGNKFVRLIRRGKGR